MLPKKDIAKQTGFKQNPTTNTTKAQQLERPFQKVRLGLQKSNEKVSHCFKLPASCCGRFVPGVLVLQSGSKTWQKDQKVS